MNQLTTILLIAIIIGMITNAINIITSPGMLLGFFQEALDNCVKNMRLNLCDEEEINSFLFKAKPLFTCPPCMSSTWGSLIYWVIIIIINPFSGNELMEITLWPITILLGSFTSYLFAKFNHNI